MANLVEIDGKTSSKFRSIEDIAKDPVASASLNNLIDEAVRTKLKIQKHQQTIKDLREQAKADLSLDPKLFSFYLAMAYNNDYTKRQHDIDQASSLIHYVMSLLPDAKSHPQIEDDEE